MTENDVDHVRKYCTAAINKLMAWQQCDHDQEPTVSINVQTGKNSKALIFTSYLDKMCEKCEHKDALVCVFEIK